MPVSTTIKFKAKSMIKRAKPKIQSKWLTALKGLIIDSMERGFSPVKNGGDNPASSSGTTRYKGYSPKYRKDPPVNLKVSGQLHKSLRGNKVNNGVFLKFNSDIAKYHDIEGAGKSKVIRRMLPRNGEEFNSSIMRKLVKIVSDNLKK